MRFFDNQYDCYHKICGDKHIYLLVIETRAFIYFDIHHAPGNHQKRSYFSPSRILLSSKFAISNCSVLVNLMDDDLPPAKNFMPP